jgi:predicted heme/steroid binding protein
MLKYFLYCFVCCCAIAGSANAGEQLGSATTASAVSPKSPDTAFLRLTLAELAGYNGQNGMPAYVAVFDTIYDVSKVKAWANGKHHGSKAGTDVTKAFMKSPHKRSLLKKLKKVGIIVAGGKSADAGGGAVVKPAPDAPPTK